jgi:hypothetical protein
VATEPLAFDLIRAAEHTAYHLELRDSYTPDDPDWLDWQAGVRFDPAERWASFADLVRDTVARGVSMRRVRIVSEPVTEYIRFEYDVTAAHNVAAGEEVRWLPRASAAGLLVPAEDFWVCDGKMLLWNHFAGDGSWVGEERSDNLEHARLCAASFEAAWERAIPHAKYRPA